MHKLQQFLKSYKSCFCAIQFIFQIFFYIWFHTYTSRWSNGGGGKFPPPFLVNFDEILVDFDAKTQTGRGEENMPKIQNGGDKKGDRPLNEGDKFSRNFLRGGGKLTFLPLSLTLVHVCMVLL